MSFASKAVVAALLIATLFGMAMHIKAQKAENSLLREQLASANATSLMRKTLLEQVSNERERMNTLLIERANRNAKQEEKLRYDIQFLEQQVADSRCAIPDTITEQLRQPY